jgi:hypothetical protein
MNPSLELKKLALLISKYLRTQGLRRTDPDLAQRLKQKAEYWTNPENWSEDEIDHNGIQIEEIAEEGRRLLSDV